MPDLASPNQSIQREETPGNASPLRFDRLSRWVILVVLGTVFAASFFLPATPLYEIRVCLFYHLTGVSCPACGLGRSFCALSDGDVGLAMGHNPAGPFVYLGLLVWFGKSAAELRLGRELSFGIGKPVRRFAWAMAGIVFLVLWIIRF